MLLNFDYLVKKYDMNIKGVIQIGAHYGEEHETYKKHNITNIIYFEPLKKNVEVLKKNVCKDSPIIFECALGNENKQIEMFVESANNGQSSSVLQPGLHLFQYPHIVFDKKEKVKMNRLDDMGIDSSLYNLINIDVQGYELEVFKGSVNFLNNIDYIISEINRDEVYVNCTKINDLINFLKPYGFELVEQSWDGTTWGDGFFVKKTNENI